MTRSVIVGLNAVRPHSDDALLVVSTKGRSEVTIKARASAK